MFLGLSKDPQLQKLQREEVQKCRLYRGGIDWMFEKKSLIGNYK